MHKVPDPRLVRWMNESRDKDSRPSSKQQEQLACQFPNWHEEILEFLMLELGMKAQDIVLALKGGHRHWVLDLMRMQMGRNPIVVVIEVAA